MFNKNAIKHDFSKAAGSYDQNAFIQQQVRSNAVNIASKFWADNSQILDVGCGTAEIAKEMPGWKITGVDISYGMCKVAKSKNIDVLNADAAALPFSYASFDNIFSSLFLQWANDPKVVIGEILRVLKPGGKAVVTNFINGTLFELEEAFKSVDSSKHVSSFINAEKMLADIKDKGGIILHSEERMYKEYYDAVLPLMRSIKNIGASNKHSERRRGLMTNSAIKKMEKAYIVENGKLPVSWKVITVVIGKAHE